MKMNLKPIPSATKKIAKQLYIVYNNKFDC